MNTERAGAAAAVAVAAADDADDDFVVISKMWMFLNWHTADAVAAAVVVAAVAGRHGDGGVDAVGDMDPPISIANYLNVYAAHVY